jgi:hypothetical protein
VSKSSITSCLSSATLVHHMSDLFDYVASSGGKIIVISDSYTDNVECGLEGTGLAHHVSKIYTHPSVFTAAGELTFPDSQYRTTSACEMRGGDSPS